MNPGPLLLPYLAILAYLALRRRPALLTVWAFAFLALPTIRSRFGPVSVYWSDLAAVAVLVRFVGWRVRTPGLASNRRWMVLLLATLSVGAMTTILRYGTLLEPGYWMYRFALGMLPLTVLPRALVRPELLEAIAKGVYTAGVTIGLVAIAQSLGGAPADLVDTLFYGGYDSRNQPSGMRIYGMYFWPTALAGAGVLVSVLSLLLLGLGQRHKMAYASVAAGALAALLTYSRHGLLALLVVVATLAVLNPRRLARTLGGVALAALIASAVVNVDYWELRLARGGITEDPNLRARLVQRPQEFWERLTTDSTFGLFGVGLGLEHTLEGRDYSEATFGFVSNTLLLYLVFAGVAAFLAFLAMFLTTLRRAFLFGRNLRAVAVASLLGVLVVLASDNYGFYNTSIWFMWACVVGVVRAASHPLVPRRAARRERYQSQPSSSQRRNRPTDPATAK